MSRRIAVTAASVSEPSASISFRTCPSRWNSSSVRNRSRFFSLYFCTKRQGLGTVLAQTPGLREVEHLSDHLKDAVRLVGRVPGACGAGRRCVPGRPHRSPSCRGRGSRTSSPASGRPRPSAVLHRTWTCSVRYRSASSATVGAGAGFAESGSGSSPALMRAIIWVALARACSDVMTPWRPIATRFDFPPARV